MSSDREFENEFSFPYLIRNVDQLPSALSELVKQYIPEKLAIDGIFVMPQGLFPRGYRYVLIPIHALIFTNKGVLFLSASTKSGKSAAATWIGTSEILKIKVSVVLLNAMVEIWGVRDGKNTKITMDYSTVGHRLMLPLVFSLLRNMWSKNRIISDSLPVDATFPDFVNTSFSFYNGLTQEAIQPDEKIIGHLFQPEITRPWMRYFKRRVFPKFIFVLTDKQMIVLQEDLKYKVHHEWLFSFVSLSKISSVNFEESDDLIKIAIRHKQGDEFGGIDLMIEPSQADEWRRMEGILLRCGVGVKR